MTSARAGCIEVNLCAWVNGGVSICRGIIAGRSRLHAGASLRFLFDDVPHHKALNTQMRRLQEEREWDRFDGRGDRLVRSTTRFNFL